MNLPILITDDTPYLILNDEIDQENQIAIENSDYIIYQLKMEFKESGNQESHKLQCDLLYYSLFIVLEVDEPIQKDFQ